VIFLPLASLSVANGDSSGTGSWTGVKVKLYEWKATTVNNDTFQELYTDLNFSEGAPELTRDEISNMSASNVNLYMDVLNITTDVEVAGESPKNSTKVEVNGTMKSNGKPFGLGEMSCSLYLDNMSKAEHYDDIIYYPPFASDKYLYYTVPLDAETTFHSTNYNYTYVVQEYIDDLSGEDQNPLVNGTDFTISKSGNGFQIWYNKSALNQLYDPDYDYIVNQTKELEFTMKYDDNGVLSLLEVKYGGDIAIAWEQVGGGGEVGQVPGYGLFSLLGVSATAIFCLVYLSKREKVL
jgi:hypothetical protein